MDEITGFNEQMNGLFSTLSKLNKMPKLQRGLAMQKMKMNAMKNQNQSKKAKIQMIIRLLNTL